MVPLDGSKLAEAALDEAVDLAAGAPVTYMLIRAAEAHALPVADPMQAQVKVVREAEEYPERCASGWLTERSRM